MGIKLRAACSRGRAPCVTPITMPCMHTILVVTYLVDVQTLRWKKIRSRYPAMPTHG
jgi:hypothetical protein